MDTAQLQVLIRVIVLKDSMARKFYEQMLINELEIRKATSFPKWYAAPNQMYYGSWNQDLNQDVKNVRRVNRQDLYSVEYYRQPFWMPPQNLVFPNYQPVPVCFFRRNNRRFSSGKNSFSRDKRSNSEKKFLRQEDVLNFREERGKTTDFQSQFGRYQEGWNKDGSRHQIPRDDRGVSYLAIRNPNFDLCSDNMMVQQHVVENRHPSFECLSVHENLPNTGYSRKKNSLQADSQNSSYKTSDLDWENQADHVSKSTDLSQYPGSQNYNNSYESWYCPEEQQKIVDMLKEVNLRHDRQLKSDMLLSQSEQSSDDLVSGINDSQTSLSSEDDDDNVTILLYPGGIPPIPEAGEEDELLKSECYDKSANNLFEEFQNIFTGSPEKKIINKIIKEVSEKSQIVEDDDDLGNTGNVITDDDKNAVKTVLDFDHMDDQTENTFDDCENIASSSEDAATSNNLENKSSVLTSKKQIIFAYEECHLDMKTKDVGMETKDVDMKTKDVDMKSKDVGMETKDVDMKTKDVDMKSKDVDMKTKDVEMTSDSDSVPQLNNSSSSYSCSEVVESGDNFLLASLKQATKTLGSKKYPKTKSPKDSQIVSVNNSFDAGKYANEDPYVTTAGNEAGCNSESGRKSKKYIKNTSKDMHIAQLSQKKISKESYDKGTLKNKLHLERTGNQYNSSLCSKISSSTLNNMKVFVSNRSNENISHENLNRIKNIDKTQISQNNTKNYLLNSSRPLFSHKTFQKKACGLSVSELFLPPKTNHAEFKRISVSEIFSNSSAALKHEYQQFSDKQRITHMIDLNKNMKDMSPSEHLKLILGIGQNHSNTQWTCKNTFNNSEKNATLDAFQSTDKLETNSKIQNYEIMSKSLQKKDSKSSCYAHNEYSTKMNSMHKENQSKAPEEDTNIEKDANRKSVDKYCNNSIDLNRSNNLTSESNMSEKIKDSVTKCKKKQRNRKGKPRKESFTDEGMPSPINFTEQNIKQNPSCQSNGNKIAEKRSNCDQKLTPDVGLQTHKSFRESKKNNEYILNGDSRKKTETKQLKTWTSNYSDRKKSFKDSEVLMAVDGSNLSRKTRKTSDEISETVNCNVASSNRKNMTSSNLDQMKSINNEKYFVDQRFSSLSSRNDKNSNYLLTGMHSKHTYPNFQITNTKHFHQKQYNKSREIYTHLDAEFSSESNKTGNLLTSLNSKPDSAKTHTANSKYSHNKSTGKDDGSYASPKVSHLSVHIEKDNNKLSSAINTPKTRKKNKIKLKEKSIDKCENQSKLEQYNQTKQNNKMNYSSKESLQENSKDPMNEIIIKSASSNSKKHTNNFSPNSETEMKQKCLEKSHTFESSDSSFNNTALVCGPQKYSSKFYGHDANMKEESTCFVSKNSTFHSSKSRKAFRIDENASYKEENFPENTTLSRNDKYTEKLSFSSVNKCTSSNRTNLNEDSEEKKKYMETKICNNDKNKFLEENILRRTEEKIQTHSMRSTNSTMLRNFPSVSDSHNLCYDKASGFGEKKELYKKENCNSKHVSLSNEKETKAYAYNGLRQEKEQKMHECTSQEFTNDETNMAHYYKNPRTTNGKLLVSKDLKLKIASNKDIKGKTEEVVKTTFQGNPFAFSPVRKDVNNRVTDILSPIEEHGNACSKNGNLLASNNLKLQATSSKDTGGKIGEIVKTTFQAKSFAFPNGSKDLNNRKTDILSLSEEHRYACSKNGNSLASNDSKLQATSSKDTGGKIGEIVKTTFQAKPSAFPHGSKDLNNRKTDILAPSEEHRYSYSTSVNTVHTIPLLTDISKTAYSLLNVCSIDSALMDSMSSLKKKVQNNPLTKNMSLNEKSLKSKNPCILKEVVKFGDFLNCFVEKHKRKLKKKNLKMSTSGAYEITNSLKQRNTEFMRSVFVTVTPEVMDTYMRNKKALKMNLFLDVHVNFYLEDLFSDFEFVRLDPEFKSVLHLPYNKDNIKKCLNMDDAIKEAGQFKLFLSYNKAKIFQNYVNNVRKC